LYFVARIFHWIPETRCFRFKAWLLSFAGVKVGRNVKVCSSAAISGDGTVIIGDDSWIGQEVRIYSGAVVKIGNSVDIGPLVYIGTGSHVIDPVGAHSAGRGRNLDVVVCDGAWLGARCLILPGVTIGQKAVVAAGAVVTKDVPEMCIVAGIPAVVKKRLTTVK